MLCQKLCQHNQQEPNCSGEGRGGAGRGGEGVGKNWRMLTKLRDVLSEPRMLKSTVNCKSPEANVTSSTSENYRKFHHQNVP